VTADAIRLEAVGKRYVRTTDAGLFVKRLADVARGRRAQAFWALQDLDLAVREGETLGVIGRNGSGKTTLLRLLAGVTAPSAGHLTVRGSIAPLIGVGVGFDPELTGRENVFANGQILGMSKARLRRDLDEIVAFSELEEFLDTPVKYYSSGMFLRLAFAVAIQLEPDVLLVDEVLAVGDLAFQMKCFERMRRLQRNGTTIVVVTHNLGLLEQLCDRAVVLHSGRKAFDGDVDGALGAYHDVLHLDRSARAAAADLTGQQGDELRFVGGAAVEVEVLDRRGRPVGAARSGQPLLLRVTADFEHEVEDPVLGIAVRSDTAGPVYMVHTLPGEYQGSHGPGHPFTARATMDTPLLPGRYSVLVNVCDRDGEVILGSGRPARFAIASTDATDGVVDLAPKVVA
jgi:ABC-type polysaccharide/polyol phosphate transport system ATPase subunit